LRRSSLFCAWSCSCCATSRSFFERISAFSAAKSRVSTSGRAARTVIVCAVCQKLFRAQEKSERKTKFSDESSVTENGRCSYRQLRSRCAHWNRQSIPSSNIESCACVSDTVPLDACGQMNLPRSNRFAKRPKPVAIPLQQLEQVSAPAAKNENLSRKWLCVTTRSRFYVAGHDMWRSSARPRTLFT
jgi:hypothetical protein